MDGEENSKPNDWYYDVLSQRCASEEPSRDLDAAIARQMGYAANYEGDGVYGCPAYTTSVDAALTLVPSGFGWSVSGHNSAFIHYPNHTHCEHVIARNPALAVCAVALLGHASRFRPGPRIGTPADLGCAFL